MSVLSAIYHCGENYAVQTASCNLFLALYYQNFLQNLSLLCKKYLFPAYFHKRHLVQLLQILDVLSHRWLGNMQVCRRTLFENRLIVRESGSGTRGILEQFLQTHNQSLEKFKNRIEVSNMAAIRKLVAGKW